MCSFCPTALDRAKDSIFTPGVLPLNSCINAGRGRSISQILTGRCRCYAKMSPGSFGASPRTVQYKQIRLDPWGRRQPG
ncbi:ATP-dependent Clp protease ATP-binding subunit ClpX [Trichinella pseudospiralis]